MAPRSWQLPGIGASDYDASRDEVSLTADQVRYQPVYVSTTSSLGTPTLRVGRGGGRYMGYDLTLSSALLTEGLVANKSFATSPPTTVTPYTTLTTSGDGFAHSVFMRVSTP